MLTVEFWNVTGDTDVADYEVRVRVNDRLIHTERVNGHTRADGWRALVVRLGVNEALLADEIIKRATP